MKTINREVLEFIHEELELSVYREEARELVDNLESEYDFYQEIDGEEYRFIKDIVIWDVYVDEIQEVIRDCYGLKVPEWVAIDWEKTAENCHVDNYGRQFSSYDGSEIEYDFDDQSWWIFRTKKNKKQKKELITIKNK